MWQYEIAVRGPVPDRVLAELLTSADVDVATFEPGGSVLTTRAADQAALLGLLERLQDLGLTFREFRAIPPSER